MGDTASATKDPTTAARWDGILGRWLRVGRMTCSFLRAGLRGIGAISRLWWVDLQWQRTQTDKLHVRLCSANACSSVADFGTWIPSPRCLIYDNVRLFGSGTVQGPMALKLERYPVVHGLWALLYLLRRLAHRAFSICCSWSGLFSIQQVCIRLTPLRSIPPPLLCGQHEVEPTRDDGQQTALPSPSRPSFLQASSCRLRGRKRDLAQR